MPFLFFCPIRGGYKQTKQKAGMNQLKHFLFVLALLLVNQLLFFWETYKVPSDNIALLYVNEGEILHIDLK